MHNKRTMQAMNQYESILELDFHFHLHFQKILLLNCLHLQVVTPLGIHPAADYCVQINVKTITVTHLMDPVFMDALIQTLSQLTALVFFQLQKANLECVICYINKSLIFTIWRQNVYQIKLKYILSFISQLFYIDFDFF